MRLKGRIGMITEYRKISPNIAVKTVDRMKKSELRYLRNRVSRPGEQGNIKILKILLMVFSAS